MLPTIFANPIFNVIATSLLIFFCRIIDVSLGTLRFIFISKNNKGFATLVGFFEITIWLFVVRQVIMNMDNIFYFLAYSAGFATGTFVGLLIEERSSQDRVIIRIISNAKRGVLLKRFREIKCSVTFVDAKKEYWNTKKVDNVRVFYIVANIKHVKEIIESLKDIDHNAHYTVEKITETVEDVFEHQPIARPVLQRLSHFKKSK